MKHPSRLTSDLLSTDSTLRASGIPGVAVPGAEGFARPLPFVTLPLRIAKRLRRVAALLAIAVSMSSASLAGDIYVAEANASRLARLDASGTRLETITVPNSRPFGIECGPNGNLLVATQQGAYVAEMDGSSGSFVGQFAAGLGIPYGVIATPNGTVLVSDFALQAIHELDGTTGAFIRDFAPTLVGVPVGMAYGPNGNLFVAVGEPGVPVGRIVELDAASGAVVRQLPDLAGQPRDVAFGPDGAMYAPVSDNTVVKLDPSTGAVLDVLTGLSGPHSVRFSPDGELFVANYSNGTVVRYDAGLGSFVTVASGLTTPIDLLFGTDSGPCAPPIYVSDSGSGSILRFDGATGELRGTFGTTGPRPFGMTCAPNGNLLVATQEGNTLVELDNSTGASLGAFAAGLALPAAAVTGPNGNVFVAEFNANRVVELDGRSGAFLRIVTAEAIGPLALAFGSNGNLFVSQNLPNDGVVEVDPATGSVVNTFAIAGRPRALLFNPQGRLYITILLSDTVVDLDVDTGQTSVLSGGLTGPHGIALNPTGDLFVVSSHANQLARYDPSGGTFEPFATDGLSSPLGVIVGTSSGPCSVLPPTADPGGPYNAAEGDVISLNGGASTDPEGFPLEYSWDLDNDSTPDQTGSPATLHVFAEGQQTVELTVTDMSGLSDTASTTVTVIDTPATVHAGPDQTVPEGQGVYVSASFIDPGIFDQHTAQIDWGDGGPPQVVQPIDPQGAASGAVLAGHSYAWPGLYEVSVTVTDIANGAGSSDTLTVNYGLAPNTFGSEPPIFSDIPQGGAEFGFSADVDGEFAVVGAPADDAPLTDQGDAYVFRRNGANWDLVQRLAVPDLNADDFFGWSVAVSGSTIAVGARGREVPAPAGSNHGAVFVFETRDGGSTWDFVQELSASDAGSAPFFGAAVDIDGGIIVAGSGEDDQAGPNSGAIYVFERGVGGWTETAKLTGADAGAKLGTSVAVFGVVVVGGAPYAGAGAVFAFDLLASGPPAPVRLDGVNIGSRFGYDVAMFGDTVIVGAPFDTVIPGLDRHGAAYAVRWDGAAGAFGAPQLLMDGPPGANQRFGETVAIHGNLALVGSPFFSLPVAVFERRGQDDWGPDADGDGGVDPTRSLAASPPQAANIFGSSVAVWGDTALVGAALHDTASPAVADAGAAFPFTLGAVDPADYYDPLTLTSPPGGQTSYPGEPVAISWTGGLSEWSVEINLVQTFPSSGITAVAVVSNSDGSYDWVLPSTLACGTDHRYRFSVQQQGNPSSAAQGPEFNAPCPPGLTFISPPAGSSFTPGESVTVGWTGGAPLWAVSVYLHRRSPTAANLGFVATVPNSQPQVDYVIPETLACGAGYSYGFYIQEPTGIAWRYGPDFNVPCASEPLTLLAPDTSMELLPGQPVDILWTGGLPEWNVNLTLVDAGSQTPLETVAVAEPNTGDFRWTIPGGQQLHCDADYQFLLEQAPAGGGTPLDAAYGPPFRVACGNPVIITKIADTDTTMPGEVFNFTSFSYPPSLDGQYATFWGLGISHDRTKRTQGVYSAEICDEPLGGPCDPTPFVRLDTNTPIPGRGGSFSEVAGSGRQLSTDDGGFAAYGMGLTTDGSRVYGVFGDVGDGLELIADRAQYPSLDGSDIAYRGYDDANVLGVYTKLGGKVANRDDIVPEGDGVQRFFYFYDPSLDDGRTAFGASYNSFGIYTNSGGLRPVADRNTTVPDSGGLFTGLRGDSAVVDGDTIAFAGQSADASGRYRNGAYAELNGALTTLIDSRSSLPPGVQSIDAMLYVALDDGNAAVYGDFRDTTGLYQRGVFLSHGGRITIMAANGEQIDTDGDQAPDVVLRSLWSWKESLRGTRVGFQATTTSLVDGHTKWGIFVASLDQDFDRIPDDADNCALVYNLDQADSNGNGEGDACQDSDRDGVLDINDNCVFRYNPNQVDADGDGVGDVCDNCAATLNPDQGDRDFDGIGDVCDTDRDGDGVDDVADNCLVTKNPNQSDLDGDGQGDKCDPDIDGDGIDNSVDGEVINGVYVDQSTIPSGSFSDVGLGGQTSAKKLTVTTTLLVAKAADPRKGTSVRTLKDPAAVELKKLRRKKTQMNLDPSESAVITDGSVEIESIGGTVELLLGDNGEIVVSIPGAVTAKVDEGPAGELVFTNDPASIDEDVEVTLGEIVLKVPAASGAEATETTPGQFAVQATPDSLQPVKAEINGQTVVIEPGEPSAIPVNIDIKPGSDENSINLGSKGSIPVAILSSSSFDAATVDAAFVSLSSAPVKLKGKSNLQTSMEDVNGDGLLDQVVHVSTEELSLSEGDTQATLDGRLYDGTAIRGVDVIRVVP